MGSVRMIKLKQALNIRYYIIYMLLAFWPKKIVLFPDIFFYHSHAGIVQCVSEYIFHFKKQINKQKKNKNTKKAQELKKKIEHLRKID